MAELKSKVLVKKIGTKLVPRGPKGEKGEDGASAWGDLTGSPSDNGMVSALGQSVMAAATQAALQGLALASWAEDGADWAPKVDNGSDLGAAGKRVRTGRFGTSVEVDPAKVSPW